MKRAQIPKIIKDLSQKMVFLVGPRQVGKTWVAREISKSYLRPVYLNYDQTKDRPLIHNQNWLENTDLLIFDELHKMPDWKNYLKGVFDTKPATLNILVTGSARLDIFDQLGDSLAGRYFRHRLMPLSLAELSQAQEKIDIDHLLQRGGFPEPYFCSDPLDAERWRMQYRNSMLSTDVFEFDKIQNIKAIQLIFELLRDRVGSPISYQSLSEDVGISPTTVKTYIQILEALYLIFRITPYSKNIARSLVKEPKIYFFDTGMVRGDDGIKFENTVAVSLLKSIYARVDYLAEECKLHYLRTRDGKEIDFAISVNEKIEKIIEVKLRDSTPSSSLIYFHQQYNLEAIQLVKSLRQEYRTDHIQVLKAENFLKDLYL